MQRKEIEDLLVNHGGSIACLAPVSIKVLHNHILNIKAAAETTCGHRTSLATSHRHSHLSGIFETGPDVTKTKHDQPRTISVDGIVDKSKVDPKQERGSDVCPAFVLELIVVPCMKKLDGVPCGRIVYSRP